MGESLDKVDIADLARGCTHISFDVFDTLLLRLVWKPTDVFRLVAHQLGDTGFEQNRIRAEQRARHSVRRIDGYEDVTLEEIYADPALPPRAKDLELEAERQLSVANPEFLEVVAAARAAGKKLIATSDMYLPSEFVHELLETAGYGIFEYVFTPGEYRVVKSTGNLFRKILDELDLEPDQICHIGDNKHSDYELPRSLGIPSAHRPSARDRLVADGNLNPEIIQALAASSEPAASVIAGVLVWASVTDADRFADYWYRTGFAVAGPLAYGFTSWIANRATALDLEAIYFMARDGHLPLKIYERHFTGPPGEYLLGSRRAFLLPSMDQLDEKTLDQLTSIDRRVPVLELFTRLDIGLPAGLEKTLAEEFGTLGAAIETDDDRLKVARVFKEHQRWLFAAANRERDLAVGYLKSIGFFDVGRRAVVDIGWRGSTQSCLEKCTAGAGSSHGFYLGLLATGYDNGMNEGFAFFKGSPRKLRKIVAKAPEYFELLLSAPHPPIDRYERRDCSFAQVYAIVNCHEKLRLRIASHIHEGALEFSALFDPLRSHFGLVISPRLSLLCADVVLSMPAERDVLEIGAVHHSAGMGRSSYLPIISEARITMGDALEGVLFGGRSLVNTDSYWTIGYLHKHFRLPSGRLISSIAAFLFTTVKRARRARVEGVRSTVEAIGRKFERPLNAVRRRFC